MSAVSADDVAPCARSSSAATAWIRRCAAGSRGSSPRDCARASAGAAREGDETFLELLVAAKAERALGSLSDVARHWPFSFVNSIVSVGPSSPRLTSAVAVEPETVTF